MEKFEGEVKVLRPSTRGRRKPLEDKEEDAMEGMRRVMEGICISDITKEEDAREARRKLEDFMLRCQGAMARLPAQNRESQGQERADPVDECQKSMSRQLQEMREMLANAIGAGARNSAPAATSHPVRGERVAERGGPVPGADSRAQEEGEGKQKKGKKKKGDKVGIQSPQNPIPSSAPKGVQGPAPPQKGKGKAPAQGGKGKAPTQKGAKETSAQAASIATPTPEPSTAIEQPWIEVLGRKAKQAATKAAKAAAGARQTPPQKPVGKSQQGGGGGKKAPKRKVPRKSAVTRTCPQGQYARVVAEVRAKVNLEELGIGSRINTRQAATGATIFEVSGEGHPDRADRLAARIRVALQGEEGVRVDRPIKTGEVRIRGLEPSIRAEEVVAAVSTGAQCDSLCIQHRGIQQADRGAGSMWLRLPLAAAKKVAQVGHLMVGWSRAKVDLLEVRPMRCFKCLEGDTRGSCPSKGDRSGRCYRCAGTGHTSRDCQAPQKCPLCVDLGRPAGHTLGAKQCYQRKVKGGHLARGRRRGRRGPPRRPVHRGRQRRWTWR
ncbi:PREDICTED: uncharacterized protein LOC105557009 [Vollenhovia emeryi]|uniref:uncharacterized protein LOC105557009 n=1 Tax=Vollenhovia emeryi TaxID=411798 RepID=UPI0005F3941B|nr:PREDICTED: uncharacterized protein LOC105557009 [Vollenhovia emeryi]